jgi:hypothetical protein
MPNTNVLNLYVLSEQEVQIKDKVLSRLSELFFKY